MKKSKVCLSVVSLLAAMMLIIVPAFAETTIASITFEEGELEFGELDPETGLGGMNIYFGVQTLPVGATVYVAEDGEHTLSVLDARSSEKAGDWQVTAEMGDFVSDDASVTFGGTVTLRSPVVTVGLTPENPLVLVSGASATRVVTADEDILSGTYHTTWNGVAGDPETAGVTLAIDDAAAAAINDPMPFKATITWTLTNG